MRYKREAEKSSATGSIKAKDITAGDIIAGSVEADKITADRIKAKNIRAKYISVRRRRKRPKSNPDENAEHVNGQNEYVQPPQMQRFNLDQNKEHTIDQNQQSDHRSSTNQHEIEPPLPTPTIPPRLAGLLKAKLIHSKHIETNYMKAKEIKANRIHASKVQTDSINVRNKGSDITKSIGTIHQGEFNLDGVSKPNKGSDISKSVVKIPHGEFNPDRVSKHNEGTDITKSIVTIPHSESNVDRVSKPDTSEGKQTFIRNKGHRKSSKRKSKRRKRPREKIKNDRRPLSPTLPPGIVNINLPDMEKTGRELKKRLDLPPFITVADMEKADRLKGMVSSLQFLGLSDDYIKSLKTDRQRNQGHQSMKVSRSFFDPNRFVHAHSPKSRRFS